MVGAIRSRDDLFLARGGRLDLNNYILTLSRVCGF